MVDVQGNCINIQIQGSVAKIRTDYFFQVLRDKYESLVLDFLWNGFLDPGLVFSGLFTCLIIQLRSFTTCAVTQGSYLKSPMLSVMFCYGLSLKVLIKSSQTVTFVLGAPNYLKSFASSWIFVF